MEEMQGESLEEEVGESATPPKMRDIYNRLVEIQRHAEAVAKPDFKRQLYAHFNRLPASYLENLTLRRAEDVLLHQKILAEAKDPTKCPVIHVRYGKLRKTILDVETDTEDTEDGRDVDEFVSARQGVTYSSVHEIIFSTVDRPKLLSQLSALLSDIGLDIYEAHIFSTTDGFSFCVFFVGGWQEEDADGLRAVIEGEFKRIEGYRSSSTHTSILALQSKLGYDEIDFNLLELGEKVASGSSGDMYHGSYLGKDVDIKVLKPEELTGLSRRGFTQEIAILREVKHRNVISFIGECTGPQAFAIVTEYMPGGSLYSFLNKQDNILELPLLLKFALDVCKGMVYLHQNNIIHRDLKAVNLLLDSNNVVKVANFGMACFLNREGVMTAETGRYKWREREVVRKKDVYRFGSVLWELATLKGICPKHHNIHPRLSELMTRCGDTEHVDRPSFSEIEVELEELLKLVQASGETSEEERLKANEPET